MRSGPADGHPEVKVVTLPGASVAVKRPAFTGSGARSFQLSTALVTTARIWSPQGTPDREKLVGTATGLLSMATTVSRPSLT